MRKEYEAPKAEKMMFDYTETVTASNGLSYQRYVDQSTGCNETPTGEWYDGDGNRIG